MQNQLSWPKTILTSLLLFSSFWVCTAQEVLIKAAPFGLLDLQEKLLAGCLTVDHA